ncbi:MAG TPA: sulfatase-like hydrolase/transferase [Candidatus Anammoximicrobium sp.]|nr:sulfatase-like hydrolase/transferase [Candidatus Anammoximicrobium sp.]
MLRTVLTIGLSLTLVPTIVRVATAAELRPGSDSSVRPNILWITAEDIGPHLGCYGDGYAVTPNLDRLAQEGVRYTHAFATAPVCSPARSCLITGLYATSLGTQHLRSEFPIPSAFRGYPSYLRAAGFYCTNNVKTDYNTANEGAIIAASWDACSGKAHWRTRRSGQPFFAVFNLMVSHQSRASVWSFEQFEEMISKVLTPDERHDPARAPVPPYYPDTPTVRRTLARYYDCVTAMDKEVGRILAELDADGLAEDTIVFFYGDNGMGLPRGKRTLYDTGLHEPLIVRFPKKFQHLAPAAAGQAVDRLVSFVDFAPTVLSLSGLQPPVHVQGTAFLGPHAGPPRQYVYGARDRVDEAYDMARSVRDRRYLYIRNYRPHLSWNQPEGFSDNADMRREITRLAAAGQLGAVQLTYAGPAKPREELYDTDADPHQVHNLASSSDHRDVLERMRKLHRQWVLETRDLGFLPEAEVWSRCAGRTPWEMARDPDLYPLPRLLSAAELVGQPGAVSRQIELLADADPGVRYWAAVGLHAAGREASSGREALRQASKDPSASVRVEAAGALISWGEAEAALPVLIAGLQSEQLDVALHAARTLQLAGEPARPAAPVMKQVLAAAKRPESRAPQYLFLEFSLQAAIRKLEP